MPTYEYECEACGNRFEKFQAMSAAPVKKCPKCGKSKVKRLISSGAGIIFKGSGFYITDYRDAAYTDKAKAESGAGGGKDSEATKASGDAKSDGAAKSADAKSEPKSRSSDSNSGGSKSESKSNDAKPAKPESKSESKGSKKSKEK